MPAADRDASTGSSVRPRGEAAPLNTEPPSEATVTEPSSLSAGNDDIGETNDRQADAPSRDRPSRTGSDPSAARGGEGNDDDSELRVWPLPASDFAFTQSFGCVAQIGGFYNTVAGCPQSAPAFHTGIDLAAPTGTRFYAAASGYVTEAGLDREVGLANTRIVIQHEGKNDGYATEYLHWLSTYVKPGDHVRAGEPIGEVGSIGYSTGPHLHFGVVAFDSDERIDPFSWLPRDRNGNAYLGLAPNTKEITFRAANRNVPDYADPAPPRPRKRERMPDREPAETEQAADNAEREEAQERRDRTQAQREREEAREERDQSGDAAGDSDQSSESADDSSSGDAGSADTDNREQRTSGRDTDADAESASDADAASSEREDRPRSDDRTGDEANDTGKNDRGGNRTQDAADQENEKNATEPERDDTDRNAKGNGAADRQASEETSKDSANRNDGNANRRQQSDGDGRPTAE